MKNISLLFLLFLATVIHSQPNTEVYLFDLVTKNGAISIENPQNISQNPGYDNQPAFLLDGSAVLFASSRNQQTDILKYNINSGEKEWLTETDGSEYSPTPMPNKKNISAILLERDGRQLLWRYSLDSQESEVLVPYLKIGYHTWINENILFAFVLGPHNTLQMINLRNQRTEIIVEDIGRSLHKIPGRDMISFIDKSDSLWVIKSYHPGKAQFMDLVSTPKDSEDMVWLRDGSILMGKNNLLLKWREDQGENWEKFADLQQFGIGGITRLAVNPDQNRIAIVVEE